LGRTASGYCGGWIKVRRLMIAPTSASNTSIPSADLDLLAAVVDGIRQSFRLSAGRRKTARKDIAMSDENTLDAVALATELTVAWLGNPNSRVSADDVPAFLQTMFQTVTSLSGNSGGGAAPLAENEGDETFTPAVSVRKSLASKDHIVSMIDGKPYKTLRRHLKTNGLTPDGYRTRYNLKRDYPMVAESYSEARRDMAKKIGLGRKPRVAEAEAAPAAEAAPRRGRKQADA
jgi:predicted transcriptional regulator